MSRSESLPKNLEAKYNQNFSRLLETNSRKQKIDINVQTNWLTVFYLIRKTGGISDIVKKLIQDNYKYFTKAIIYQGDTAQATSLLRDLKYIIGTTLVSRQESTNSQKKKLCDFESGTSRVLITDLESHRIFPQGSIMIQEINFIINTKMPLESGIFLGRMKKKLANKNGKGVLVNIIGGSTSWNSQYYDQKSQIEKVLGFNVKMQQMTENTYLKDYFLLNENKEKGKQLKNSPSRGEKKEISRKQEQQEQQEQLQQQEQLENDKKCKALRKDTKEEVCSCQVGIQKKIKQSEYNIIQYLKSQVFKQEDIKCQLSKAKLELKELEMRIEKERKQKQEDFNKLKRDHAVAITKLQQSYRQQLEKEKKKIISQYQKLLEKFKNRPSEPSSIQPKPYSMDKLNKKMQYEDKNYCSLSDRQDKFINTLNKIIQRSFNTKFEINLENFNQKIFQLETIFNTRIYKDIFLLQSSIFPTLTIDAQSLLFNTIKNMTIADIEKTKGLLQIYNNNEISYEGWLQKISDCPNILVLLQLKNGNRLAAFSETGYQVTNKKRSGGHSGFLMSLQNQQVFKLKYNKRGQSINQENRSSLQFGNGQLIIKEGMIFEVNDRAGEKYFEVENRNIALLGQAKLEGTFVRLEVHQISIRSSV